MLDLAKSVFQVAVSHRAGRVDDERRLTRERFVMFFAQQAPATLVFEACGSAHYWARQLQPFGHTVRLLPASDVRRYVRRNRTDRTDTKGMLEANRNEEIHPVPVGRGTTSPRIGISPNLVDRRLMSADSVLAAGRPAYNPRS